MWSIFEHKTKAAKIINKAPKQVREKYEFWKHLMGGSGPEAIKKFSGFRDHALRGKWDGSRSSYLNDQYRVIYIVEKETVGVFVQKIGPHDY